MKMVKADKKPVAQADIRRLDKGELIHLMEPLLISDRSIYRGELADLAIDLMAKSVGLRRSLPKGVLITLVHLVRSMNGYYSNLIEGHDTHPVDIERALKDDFSIDPHKRHLQLEAKAHVHVQQWIDEGGLIGRAHTVEGLTEIHRRFYAMLPEELQWVEGTVIGERQKVFPGMMRDRDVKVGRHSPVSPGALSRFLAHFESVYGQLGKADSILAVAAGHHRFLWIHPFLDGNGRVARLMSHAIWLETLDTGGVWSIARGLAHSENTYKRHLMACDAQRRNDLDGRGNLSEEALVAFTRYFLETSIDQVDFMDRLVQPDCLCTRIMIWAEEEIQAGALPPKSAAVLEALLYRGALPRGDIARITGTSVRQARRIVSALVAREVLTSDSSRAPLHLAFPAKLASRWLPGLFPEKAG